MAHRCRRTGDSGRASYQLYRHHRGSARDCRLHQGSLIGTSFLGVTVHAPLGSGLVRMLVTYLLSLAIVYVMALITNALAPSFGGQPSMLQALKTVAYA